MQVVTAPEDINKIENSMLPTIFLGGGIQKCPDWQKQFIEMMNDEEVVLYNPRRDNFPINDPSAADEQITWEFNALHDCDVFTMWFCNADSDQPICFFELGRYISIKPENKVFVGVENGFRREQDVYIQMRLFNDKILIAKSLEEHVQNIKNSLPLRYY